MLELLSQYSITQILVFIVMIAIAVKESVEFIHWIKEQTSSYFHKEVDSEETIHRLEEKNKEQDEKITQILESQEKLHDNVELILAQVQSLIESDRDAIKAYITKEHHLFCYEAKWIDDYNLDCLEKRYQRYVEEGGNSFVGALMQEIRDLPRQPPAAKNNDE